MAMPAGTALRARRASRMQSALRRPTVYATVNWAIIPIPPRIG